jgi:hypothetical protein
MDISKLTVETVHCLDVLAIDLADTDSTVQATLTADMHYLVGFSDRSTLSVLVPAGFVSDLASIPRLFWSIPGFSPLDRSGRPAIFHDWCYSTRSTGILPEFSRLQADDALSACLEDEGENVVIRALIEEAVRAFGAGHWKKTA